MTMRITMLSARMGEAGAVLAKDSINTVSDAFGAQMVGMRYAIDTDGVLTPTNSNPAKLNPDGSLVDGAGNSAISDAQALSGSLVGTTAGEVRTLSDGPNKGVQIRWAIPANASTFAWCWYIYPLAKYEG